MASCCCCCWRAWCSLSTASERLTFTAMSARNHDRETVTHVQYNTYPDRQACIHIAKQADGHQDNYWQRTIIGNYWRSLLRLIDTHIQADRQTERQTDANRQASSKTDKQSDINRDRHTGRQKDRYRHRQACRGRHIGRYCLTISAYCHSDNNYVKQNLTNNEFEMNTECRAEWPIECRAEWPIEWPV